MAWWETYFDETYLRLYTSDPELDQRQVEGVVKMLELEPPARILDLCCGFVSWRQGDSAGERHNWMRIYTATELAAMLRRVGLEPMAFYGGYDLSAFTMDTRIIVASRKA